MGLVGSSEVSPNEYNQNLQKFKQYIRTLQNNRIPKETINELGSLYNAFVTPQKNVIWAGALNLSFTDFKKDILKSKDLSFGFTNKEIEKYLKPLNNPKFSKSNISQDAIYVKSGYGNHTIKTINKQLKQKFPFKTTSELKQNLSDGDFISYAYLMKALTYEHQFERLPGVLWFGRYEESSQREPYMVEAFGAVTKQSRDQIKIIHYENNTNFFVGFKAKGMKRKTGDLQIVPNGANPQANQHQNGWWQKIRRWLPFFWSSPQQQQKYNKNPGNQVIYILSQGQTDQQIRQKFNFKQEKQQNDQMNDQIKKPKSQFHQPNKVTNRRKAKSQSRKYYEKDWNVQPFTVEKVIERVMEAQKTPLDRRNSEQLLVQFTMPVIDLEINHQHDQFKGLLIANKQLEGKNIKIIQNIKLRMDQKGVVVENDAFMGKDECSMGQNIQIIIQHPFWLVLAQQGKHPYLVVKINTLPQKVFNDSAFKF